MKRGSIWDTIGDAVRPGTNTARLVNIVFIPLLAILVLLLPPFSILARSTGGGGAEIILGPSGSGGSANGLALQVSSGTADSDVTVKVQRDANDQKGQSLPQGVVAASSFYRVSLSKPLDAPISVEVDLNEPAASGDNLDFFVKDGDSWNWVAGATLSVDGRKVKATLTKTPSALVVGKISAQSPAIAGWVLPKAGIDPVAREALNVLSPVWHAANDDGSLAGPLSDLPGGKFVVYPTIHNLAADGSAKGDTINRILRSDEVWKRHVVNIVTLVKQNSYAGVDINYQGIDPALRDKYTAFVAELATALHQEKRYLNVDLPLPEKNAQGWETGAYDWFALGKAADYLTLAAEKDQTVYPSRMPEMLAYATTQIDRRKLQLTISTLSHEKSKSGIRDVTLAEALDVLSKVEIKDPPKPILPGQSLTFYAPNLLKDAGATGISWSGTTKTAAFSYTASDGQRTVWIENSFSVAYKLQYVRQFNLHGVSVQNLGGSTSDRAISEVLSAFKTNGTVQPVDPSSQAMAISWQSSDGSMSADGASWANWTAPNSPGATYTVSLKVGDGVTWATGSRTVAVAMPPTPTPTPMPSPTPTSQPSPTSTPTPAPQQAEPTSTSAPPPPAATSTPVLVSAPPPGGVRYPGVGYGMQVDPGTDLPRSLQMQRAAGFNWVKVQIRWNAVEGSKGSINWGYLDNIVNQVSANGLRVMFGFTAAPGWSKPSDYTADGPPANPQDLADFMGAIARRYPGKVHAYEVWNEQNVFYEWGGRGRRLSAAKYVELLKAGYAAIKAADPDAVVISGGLTPTGVNDGDIAYDDVVFMDMMYQAGVQNYADAIGVHGNVIKPYAADLPSGASDHGSFYFRRFEELHAVMERYGDGGRQMWFTEFGFASSPMPLRDYPSAHLTNEAQQAEWIVKAFEIGKQRGYIGGMFLWNLNFAPSAEPDDIIAKAAFSILRRDWSPRPAYSALVAMPK